MNTEKRREKYNTFLLDYASNIAHVKKVVDSN